MTRARDLARLGNQNIIATDSNFNVGIGSLTPDAKLDVAGIVSATAFYGDGSNLEGVASAGLGTALNSEATDGLQVIYYTDKILSIGSTITIDPPTSTNAAYTQYAEIVIDADADLIIADGDDFIPDVLGLSTEGATPLPGSGGRVRADYFTNKAGTGAPTFNAGLNVTGVATATTFSGNISGTTGTFSGNVSIGGTLTYEDVTNVDSVGLITARTGVRVTSGGIVVTAGVSTFSGAQKISTGAEKVHRQSGNTVTLSFNSASSSNVGYTTNPDGNITLAVTDIPTSSDFDDHSITFALIVNSTGTARTCTAVTLNGVSKTIRWAGGSLDNAISGVTTTSGHSIFNFTGINTVGSASTTANYEVFGIVSGGFF